MLAAWRNRIAAQVADQRFRAPPQCDIRDAAGLDKLFAAEK